MVEMVLFLVAAAALVVGSIAAWPPTKAPHYPRQPIFATGVSLDQPDIPVRLIWVSPGGDVATESPRKAKLFLAIDTPEERPLVRWGISLSTDRPVDVAAVSPSGSLGDLHSEVTDSDGVTTSSDTSGWGFDGAKPDVISGINLGTDATGWAYHTSAFRDGYGTRDGDFPARAGSRLLPKNTSVVELDLSWAGEGMYKRSGPFLSVSMPSGVLATGGTMSDSWKPFGVGDVDIVSIFRSSDVDTYHVVQGEPPLIGGGIWRWSGLGNSPQALARSSGVDSAYQLRFFQLALALALAGSATIAAIQAAFRCRPVAKSDVAH
jgi:hypothetical protein